MTDLSFALPEWQRHLGVPGVSGIIRERLEDFCVREIPLFEPSGEGNHLWLEVEKRGANTNWVAEQLAAREELRGAAFNFSNEIQVTVLELVDRVLKVMDSELVPDVRNEVVNEIRHQYLSAAKARELLNWEPLFTLDQALGRTVDWYRNFLESNA